ncbi:MAG: glycosyltransferase [Candidatus Dependentiae bacterium]|nr:glycosyltransferase [Candidatus Dependentiae bacterium]
MKKNIFQLFQLFIFCFMWTLEALHGNTKVCIIIPAYNEEQRIAHMLETYATYFETKPEKTTFLVVANNCKDKTVEVVEKIQKHHKNIEIIDLNPGGKGFAVKQGFLWALHKRHFDLIGFVDADMATKPEHFYDLIVASKDCDGAIASRYASGAVIEPERHWFRRMGGKIYNWMLRQQFGLPYKDTQCGAKIFTYDTIKKVTPDMTEQGWAFDLELLYLCALEGKKIAEVPTVWSDQPGSHLEISSKIIKEFTSAPNRIKSRHAAKRKALVQQKKLAKRKKSKNNSTQATTESA